MTTASKSGHLRDVAVSTGGNAIKAARLYSAGPAVIGFRAAQHGVGLARREKHRHSASRTAAPSRPKVKTKGRKLILVGALLGVAAAVALVLSKRRATIDPPADAPPSLDDYAHITSPVNGSSAHSSRQ